MRKGSLIPFSEADLRPFEWAISTLASSIILGADDFGLSINDREEFYSRLAESALRNVEGRWISEEEWFRFLNPSQTSPSPGLSQRQLRW